MCLWYSFGLVATTAMYLQGEDMGRWFLNDTTSKISSFLDYLFIMSPQQWLIEINLSFRRHKQLVIFILFSYGRHDRWDYWWFNSINTNRNKGHFSNSPPFITSLQLFALTTLQWLFRAGPFFLLLFLGFFSQLNSLLPKKVILPLLFFSFSLLWIYR